MLNWQQFSIEEARMISRNDQIKNLKSKKCISIEIADDLEVARIGKIIIGDDGELNADICVSDSRGTGNIRGAVVPNAIKISDRNGEFSHLLQQEILDCLCQGPDFEVNAPYFTTHSEKILGAGYPTAEFIVAILNHFLEFGVSGNFTNVRLRGELDVYEI